MLSTFLLYYSQSPPRTALRIEGSHMDMSQNRSITDFTYGIDLTPFIQIQNGMPDIYGEDQMPDESLLYLPNRQQEEAQTVLEHEICMKQKLSPTSMRYLNQFIRDKAPLKKVTLHKTVLINYGKLDGMIRNRICNELGYRSDVRISLVGSEDYVKVGRAPALVKTLKSPCGQFCCLLSCLWIFALPIYFAKYGSCGGKRNETEDDKELLRDIEGKQKILEDQLKEYKDHKLLRGDYPSKVHYSNAREERVTAINKCQRQRQNLKKEKAAIKAHMKDPHKKLKSVWVTVFPQGREDLLYEAIKSQIR
eukprot:Nk52_evm1s1838 gene=Nk52_evmTU1s1838